VKALDAFYAMLGLRRVCGKTMRFAAFIMERFNLRPKFGES
jgi:hypothetical protein